MATVRWLGTAADIAEVDTITVANTWATGDTVLPTINGNTITITVGSTSTTAEVAAILSAAINATSATDSLVGDETRNIGGQEIPEFTEVTATVDGSVVTVTGNTPGKPFTLTCAESTAGTGTATKANVTNPTGRNWWSNADNWSTGSVPANGDDIVIEKGSVSILYGLPAGSLEPDSVTIYQSYTGDIGLPPINEDDASNVYAEYRSRYVALDDDDGGALTAVVIGLGTGSGSSRINLDVSNGAATLVVHDTGTPQTGDEVALHLANTWNEASILGGSVGFADEVGQTVAVDTLRVGIPGESNSAATVVLGTGSTVNDDLVVNAGTTYCRGAFSTMDVTQNGGLIYNQQDAAFTVVNYNAYGGTTYVEQQATITNLNISEGSIVFRPVVVASGGTAVGGGGGGGINTVTNCTATKGATINDPTGSTVFTNGIDLTRCGLTDVTIDFGPHVTITPTAI